MSEVVTIRKTNRDDHHCHCGVRATYVVRVDTTKRKLFTDEEITEQKIRHATCDKHVDETIHGYLTGLAD